MKKKYTGSILTAIMCFLIVIVLNFCLPRLLPGNPIAYLTGVAEEGLTAVQYENYENALHLNEPFYLQFYYYIESILDGTLGYSFKKERVVSSLIMERLGNTLQITIPSVIFSTLIGLVWGLNAGYRKETPKEIAVTTSVIVLNTVPTFLLALVLIIVFCFNNSILPYAGLNSSQISFGSEGFILDRLKHLILPVSALTIGAFPSRYLLMRNTAAKIAEEKYVLYAKERGISDFKIQYSYMLKNIAQPFISMVGMSVSLCIGGSLVIENIFSVNGMGSLLQEAVYSLDYPLMQGILFVTTLIMVISIVITDIICILIDPKVRLGEDI